ncbi:glycosyltransferase [Hyphococcus luteus]|uniref:Glycosyl transferase family 1 n=1 Tax=Hyphococcus luteus TaxID=2058213 RepID=A0A2S7K975_9PROT|nr:glycosyltransferase [Marinicaulis flavus]PQA89050.1 glycosyl transferase family 1 [Marinicaulis flavus]
MRTRSSALTICDVTQSYAVRGGGVKTFLSEKRSFLLGHTDAHHVLIVPGPEDRIIQEKRAAIIEIKSPQVPGSPNYRLLLRSPAVLDALAFVKPDLIECQDAYNLPWTALCYRARHPETAVVAGYHTDFPTVYVERYLRPRAGAYAARQARRLAYRYAANLYRRFDAFYTLTQIAAEHFAELGLDDPQILSLGADTRLFNKAQRCCDLRAELGVGDNQPLLIYAGRIDKEKQARVVVDAFRKLPASWGASLVMLGDGKERDALARECAGLKVYFKGFVDDRESLATYLASSDIYVSAMENETFGISVIEAQAAGLPVVGVRAGAMIDRVPPALGRLGPCGDSGAMAANIAAVWMDRLSEMGARARAHALENFSWRKTFEDLVFRIYSRALERRAGKSADPVFEPAAENPQAKAG